MRNSISVERSCRDDERLLLHNKKLSSLSVQTRSSRRRHPWRATPCFNNNYLFVLFAWMTVHIHTSFAAAEANSVRSSSSSSSSSSSAKLITMPLIPHHELVERRRRERGRRLELELQLVDNNNNSIKDSLSSSSLPDDLQIDPLYQGIGTHYVDLWIGCPPQRQTVIVDTGSGATAFPCEGCNDCGAYFERNEQAPEEEDEVHFHTDPLFHPAQSKCFHVVTCPASNCMMGECYSQADYNAYHDQLPPPLVTGKNNTDEYNACHASMAYAEGSAWFAVESRDQAYAGGYHEGVDWKEAASGRFELVFGCQTKVTGLFRTQLADGIVGMMKADTAYWQQLYKAGKIAQRQFSLCFTRTPWLTREGTGAGAMIMGGTDPRLHTTPMVFADSSRSMHDIFAVTVEGMYLRANGGESIVVPSDRKKNVIWKTISENQEDFGSITIVDSGTTSTYLMKELFEPFAEAFRELSGGLEYDMNKNYDLTNEQVAALPTVILKIKAWQDADGRMPVPDTTEINGKQYQNSIFVAFPPSHYMKYYPGNDIYQVKLGFSRTKGGFSPTTLGANFIMGHNLFFDVENNRIGFAESHCDYHAMGYAAFNHTMPDADEDSDENDESSSESSEEESRGSEDSVDQKEGGKSSSAFHDSEEEKNQGGAVDTSSASTMGRYQPSSPSSQQSSPLLWVAMAIGAIGIVLVIRKKTKRDLSAYEAAQMYADSLDDAFQAKGYQDDYDDDDEYAESASNGYHDTEMVETNRNDARDLA